MAESRIQAISLLQELDELVSQFTTPIKQSMALNDYEAMFFLSKRIQEKIVECDKYGLLAHATDQQKSSYKNVLAKQQELKKVTHRRLVSHLISLMYEFATYDPNHENYMTTFKNLEQLIQACVNEKCLNSSGDSNRSPLAVACDLHHVTLIELLLHAGADPNMPTAEKMLPIFYAIGSTHDNAARVIKCMIENGVVLYPNKSSYSPLCAAVNYDDHESLEMLADVMLHDQSETALQHRGRIFSYVLRIAARKAMDEAELDIVWSVLKSCYPHLVASISDCSKDSSFGSSSTAALVLWLIDYGTDMENIKHLVPYLFSNPVNDAFSNLIKYAALVDLKAIFDLLAGNANLILVHDEQQKTIKNVDLFCNRLIAMVSSQRFQNVMDCYSSQDNIKDMQAAWPKVSCGKSEAGKHLFAYDMRVWGVGLLFHALANRLDNIFTHLIKKIAEHNIIYSADFCLSIKKITQLCLSFLTLMDDRHVGKMQPVIVAVRAKIKAHESDFIKKNEFAAKTEKEKQRKLIHKKQKEQEKLSRQLAAEHVQKLKVEEQLLVDLSVSSSESISDTEVSVSITQPKKKKSAKQAERKKERKKARRQKNRENAVLVLPELQPDSQEENQSIPTVESSSTEPVNMTVPEQQSVPSIIITPADAASVVQTLADVKSSVDDLRLQVELLIQLTDQLKPQHTPERKIDPAYNITRMIGRLPSAFETAFAKAQSAHRSYMVGGAVIALLQYAAGNTDALHAIKDYDLVGECADAFDTLTVYGEFLPTNVKNLYKYKHGKAAGLEIDFYQVDRFDLMSDAANRDFHCSAVYLDPAGNIIDPSPGYRGLEDIRLKRVSLIQQDPHYLANKPLCLLRALKFVAKGWTLDPFVEQQVQNWRAASIPKADMLRFRSNLTKLYNGEDGVSQKHFWRVLEKYKLTNLIGYVYLSDDAEWQARRLVKVLKLVASGWSEGSQLLSNQPHLDVKQLSPAAMVKFSKNLSRLYQGLAGVSTEAFKQTLQQHGMRELLNYIRPQVLDYAFAGIGGLFQQPQPGLQVPPHPSNDDPEPGSRSPEPVRRVT